MPARGQQMVTSATLNQLVSAKHLRRKAQQASTAGILSALSNNGQSSKATEALGSYQGSRTLASTSTSRSDDMDDVLFDTDGVQGQFEKQPITRTRGVAEEDSVPRQRNPRLSG